MSKSNPFKVGDRALHKNNQLDSRPVVEIRGDEIRLEIGNMPDVWVPAENYERISHKHVWVKSEFSEWCRDCPERRPGT